MLGGTSASPPGRTGILAPQLQSVDAQLLGIMTPDNSRAGDIVSQLSGISATMTGSSVGSGLLYDNRFATGDKSHTENGVQLLGGSVNSTVVVDSGSPSGYALQLRVPPWNSSTEEAWVEQRFHLGPDADAGAYDDLTFLYVMRVPDNYTHPNGPLYASSPPAGNSDNNKWIRVWNGDTSDGNNGYSNYHLKGGFSTVPLSSWGNGSRQITEWGSDTPGEGVGQNSTPSLNGWIEPSDLGTEVQFLMRIKADTQGTPGSSMSTTGGNGALQSWKKPQGAANWTQIANLDTLSWRSASGGYAFWRYGYILGYLNQAWSEEMIWLMRRFAIGVGPGAPASFGVI